MATDTQFLNPCGLDLPGVALKRRRRIVRTAIVTVETEESTVLRTINTLADSLNTRGSRFVREDGNKNEVVERTGCDEAARNRSSHGERN